MDQHKDVTGDGREMYSNYFHVGFNSAEFLLDFGRHFEGSEPRIYQRIVTAPLHARELAALLAESVRSYEAKFGTIRDEAENEVKE